MKRVLGIGIPAVIAGLAVALTLVLAQPAPPTDEPYNFNLGKDITAEAADVLYHLLVMLEASGVDLADVYAELERRETRSGIAEKAAR